MGKNRLRHYYDGSMTLLTLSGSYIGQRNLYNDEALNIEEHASYERTQFFTIHKQCAVPLFSIVKCRVVCKLGMQDLYAVKVAQETTASRKTQDEIYTLCGDELDAIECSELARAKHGNG